MENVIIIRYTEIHLKGLNRPYFEKALVSNLESALAPIEGAVVRRGESRVYVENVPEDKLDAVMDILGRVYGVHSFSPAVHLPQDFDAAAETLAALVAEERAKIPKETVLFRVEAKRADKRFPMNSNEIAAKAGGVILKNVPGLKVNLSNPELTAYIEIRREGAYCYTSVLKGPGGMPVGCNGRVALLLSGGIDSPVAGCMITKRGVALSAVHFESFPYTSEKALEKVHDLAKLMARYTGPIRLHTIRFTDIQMTLYEKCPSDYLTVMMRRFMMRIAERIAEADGCKALVTGESLGQVASQTLDSLGATDNAVDMLVLRPLIGLDKLEITNLAERFGTFETSILPYEDCCTVFVPKHPVTRPRMETIHDAEDALDVEGMITAALATDVITEIGA